MMSTGEPKSKKPMAVAALFFNENGKILLVKPNYKDHWSMPGGAVEEKESPSNGCVREIKEELALDIKKENLKLLSVDYVTQSSTSYFTDAIRFVFFAGIISDEQISKIKLQESELENMEFVEVLELSNKLSIHTARAINESVLAYQNKETVYLEDGYKIGLAL